MSLQVVYVLTNAAMPGFVKIGMTTLEDAQQRIDQLYTTGVPFPFEVNFVCKVPNAYEVERALHLAFAPYRSNPKREFFNISAEQAIAILKLLHVQDVSSEIAETPSVIEPEETAAAKNFRARRPNQNFAEMGIPPGSHLIFATGEATAEVVSDKKVRLNGEEMSLTAATRQVRGTSYSVEGSRYWTFNGRSLDDIYEETYVRES